MRQVTCAWRCVDKDRIRTAPYARRGPRFFRRWSMLLCCGSIMKSSAGSGIWAASPSTRRHQGRLPSRLGSHRVPADSPVNCSFGGEDLSLLFVTTASGELLCVRSNGMRGQNRTA
jgi:hypothetical protein